MTKDVNKWQDILQLAYMQLPDIEAAGQTLQRLGYIKDRHLNAIHDSQLSRLGKVELTVPDLRAIVCWQVRGLLGGLQFLLRFSTIKEQIPPELQEEIVQACKETISLLLPDNHGAG